LTSSARLIAKRAAAKPPTELPTTTAPSGASWAISSSATSAKLIALAGPLPGGEDPCPGQSREIERKRAGSSARSSS
jgi:hypothetical protein